MLYSLYNVTKKARKIRVGIFIYLFNKYNLFSTILFVMADTKVLLKVNIYFDFVLLQQMCIVN